MENQATPTVDSLRAELLRMSESGKPIRWSVATREMGLDEHHIDLWLAFNALVDEGMLIYREIGVDFQFKRPTLLGLMIS
jgi:hypothetical protein